MAAGFREKIGGKTENIKPVKVKVNKSYEVIISGFESQARTREKKGEYERLLNCPIELSYNYPFSQLCFGSYSSEVEAFKKLEELKKNKIVKVMVIQGINYSYSPVK